MEHNCFLYENLSFNPSLFSNKELYLMAHTRQGKSFALNKLSTHRRKILTFDNHHLIGNMSFSYENNFPVMKPYNLDVANIEFYSYSNRNRHTEKPWGVHFFMHDYRFLRAITVNLEKTTRALYESSVVFAPDCSLYVDVPDFMNKQSIFRSRFAAAYWQSCGYHVIQTASWGNANSLKYAFEGLAPNSITAVCGIGHNYNRAAKRLWIYGLEKLIEQKKPTKLIVYGGSQKDVEYLDIPVIFIEDYINTNFRNK